MKIHGYRLFLRLALLAVAAGALLGASSAAAQSLHLEWLNYTTGVPDKIGLAWPAALSVWRELSPTFGDLLVQQNKFDIDHNLEVSDGDYVLLAKGGLPTWYRVAWGGTLCFLADASGNVSARESVVSNPPGGGPVGEGWRLAYPTAGGTETVLAWTDANANTLLDGGDGITLGSGSYTVVKTGFGAMVEEGDPIPAGKDSWGGVKSLYGGE